MQGFSFFPRPWLLRLQLRPPLPLPRHFERNTDALQVATNCYPSGDFHGRDQDIQDNQLGNGERCVFSFGGTPAFLLAPPPLVNTLATDSSDSRNAPGRGVIPNVTMESAVTGGTHQRNGSDHIPSTRDFTINVEKQFIDMRSQRTVESQSDHELILQGFRPGHLEFGQYGPPHNLADPSNRHSGRNKRDIDLAIGVVSNAKTKCPATPPGMMPYDKLFLFFVHLNVATNE